MSLVVVIVLSLSEKNQRAKSTNQVQKDPTETLQELDSVPITLYSYPCCYSKGSLGYCPRHKQKGTEIFNK